MGPPAKNKALTPQPPGLNAKEYIAIYTPTDASELPYNPASRARYLRFNNGIAMQEHIIIMQKGPRK